MHVLILLNTGSSIDTMIEWRFLSTQHLNEFASNSVETYKPICYVIGQFYMYDCVISVCSLNHVHDTRT